MAEKRRLLIFVIAYCAEQTLKSVLERIPSSIFEEYETEVLVVDDASEDRTFAIGREYVDDHPDVSLTVLRNQLNQGYGGNQKVGYAFAIEGGFDFVAMVHGDGQYAPEELPRLVAPLRDGIADAVFGSRMMSQFGAIKGGMPLYKYLGNKILTRAQNLMLGTRLSEFHSGYRVYATSALVEIAFLLNSNDFHFDTEIILQLLNANKRILELPIPTFYGDEISRVNGMKYAKDVIVSTMRNVAHRAGIFYQRKFEPIGDARLRSHGDLKLGYPSSHSYALEQVPAGASVLDIGSGSGEMARELRAKGCRVALVAAEAQGVDVPLFEQDLDDTPAFPVENFDYLLMLDVIEHLKDPERFLDELRSQFTWSTKTVVLTTPNIAFFVHRLMLLLGQFNYGHAGILDRTHKRLLTVRSLRHLLNDAGFRIKTIRGVPAPFPKAIGDGFLARAAVKANLALIRFSKTLFAYQIFVVAESTPDVAFVLRDAKERSEFSEQQAARDSYRAAAVDGPRSSSGLEASRRI